MILTLRHIFPVIIFSIIFNITKFIAISPIGPTLQKIPNYLKFILFFQAFHPLITTGLGPLLILISLNYKVLINMVYIVGGWGQGFQGEGGGTKGRVK